MNNDYYQRTVLTDEEKWDDIRDERNRLLRRTDWTTLPDATPKPSKDVWIKYRQELRDITSKYKNPDDVVWPEIPK